VGLTSSYLKYLIKNYYNPNDNNMKRKDSLLSKLYYQPLPKAKEGGNYFNKYKVPVNTTSEKRVDPILSFFNGGFLMPAKQGGMLAYPNNNNQSGYLAPRMSTGGPVGIYGYRNYDDDILINKAMGGDISIPDLDTSSWLMKYDVGGPGPGDGTPARKFGFTNSAKAIPAWSNGKFNPFAGMTSISGSTNRSNTPAATFNPANYNNGYATNDANSNLTRQQNITTDYTNNQVDQQRSRIANYRNSPYAIKDLSDSQILQIVGMNDKAFQNQGAIKKAGADPSFASKAWAIASNPMTALKYKMNGQDIPNNFEKGERNALDMAVDVINPAMYMNAAGRTAGALVRPFNTAGRLFNGARDLAYNLAGDDVGYDNVLDVAGIVGDAAMFIPGVSTGMRGLGAARKELLPFVKGAKETYSLTGDLPFAKRFRNALNAGTTKYKLDNIDDSKYVKHTFGSNYTSEQALAEIAQQKATAPMGAMMGDGSMSLNSTPLYFQSAARGIKEFPVVRTGVFQPMNDWGFKGKKISQSIPKRVYTDYPDVIQEYNQGVNRLNIERQARLDRIAKDPSLSNAERTRMISEADMLYKKETGNIIPERQALKYVENEPGLFNEFVTNYKPHMDASIASLSERTGLNFPGTKGYIHKLYGPRWEAPTAYSVKGSFAPRYKAIGNRAIDAFKKEFNPNLKIKTGTNSSAADEFDRVAPAAINQRYDPQVRQLEDRFSQGLMTNDEFDDAMRQIYSNRSDEFDNFYNTYPNGRPAIENTYFSVRPKYLSTPGMVNNAYNINPSGENIGDNYLKNIGNYVNTDIKGFMDMLRQQNSNRIFFK